MTTWDFRFFQILSIVGFVVALVGLWADGPSGRLLTWVVALGLPFLCFLVAGVGHASTRRLEAIEAALKGQPRP